LNLGSELFKHAESIFRPQSDEFLPIGQFLSDCLNKCDSDIQAEIQENICLTGGSTLLKGFTDRLKNELHQSLTNSNFNLVYSPERQYSNWIGGSIISSLSNFMYMWVTKQDYDAIGNSLEAIESKCF